MWITSFCRAHRLEQGVYKPLTPTSCLDIRAGFTSTAERAVLQVVLGCPSATGARRPASGGPRGRAVGPATRRPESAFSTNAGICARRRRRGRRIPQMSKTLWTTSPIACKSAFHERPPGAGVSAILVPPWTRSSTGCSPTSRRRRAPRRPRRRRPGRDRSATAPRRDRSRRRCRRARTSAGPADAPLGPGAPRIAIYDTLTSPPRV